MEFREYIRPKLNNLTPVIMRSRTPHRVAKLNLCFLLALALGVSACKTETAPEPGGWIYLFDGTSTEGWRAYNEEALPPWWIAKDGLLTIDPEKRQNMDYEGSRDIIYGAQEFDNFELSLEWKLPEGGNSGIFYHLKEGYSGPPEVAPEYQLIDDVNYAKHHDLTTYNLSLGHTQNPRALQPLQQTGADYAMYAPDSMEKILYPVGEWNTTRIVFTPEQVEHWLNGKKVVSFVPWSTDWYERKNTGKWKDKPDYGKFKSGYIGFQDHDSPIWFKNIKIKELKPGPPPQSGTQPALNHLIAHSHNDYEQSTPIYLALDNHFNSLEVDIYPFNNELKVSHDDVDLPLKQNLDTGYLSPLIQRLSEEQTQIVLLIDIKQDTDGLLDTLHNTLSMYDEVLVKNNQDAHPKALVQVILSGDINREEVIRNKAWTYFFIDGRPEYINSNISSSMMPWISTNLADHVEWDGKQPPDENATNTLKALIDSAHAKGFKVRFWNTNDSPSTWLALLKLEVDIIGVDDIPGFKAFITTYHPSHT